MRALSKEMSDTMKKRLANKLRVSDQITDWSKLSGVLPLWSLANLSRVYESVIVISDEGKRPLFTNFGDFLCLNDMPAFLFPADGYIVSIPSNDMASYKDELKHRTIIEVEPSYLKKFKSPSGWIIPEDIYFFDEDISWLLFACHEKFEVLCGSKPFINEFTKSWIDYDKYIDSRWSDVVIRR